MKNIAILGSTGSIGRSALAVVDAHPSRLRVVALAAGDNAALLAEQVARYRPEVVAMATDEAAGRLRASSGDILPSIERGPAGLIAVATHAAVDIVICASAGTAGLEAVLAAIAAGKTIALANKEVLVMAGALVTDAARRRGVPILPVDSEHNAIHQCLHGRSTSEIRRLILTASGGPFRQFTPDALDRVEPEAALRHPTWQMGRKITIDSATLMNKGLEVIEARWLFDIAADRISVLVHPQSIVHSMVEFVDGSILAQLSVTDMRLPIQYALAYPERWGAVLPPLDLTQSGPLTFEAADTERFPCLELAFRAVAGDNGLPIVLNAANEVAVAAFMDSRLAFTAIPEVIEASMADYAGQARRDVRNLADVRTVDREARRFASRYASELQFKIS